MYRPHLLPFLAVALLPLTFSCDRKPDVAHAAGSTQVQELRGNQGRGTLDETGAKAGQGANDEKNQDEKNQDAKGQQDKGGKGAEKAAADETGFSRFVETGKLAGRFETSIVSYKDAKGRQVDLVAAVHIADNAYYKDLQKRMEAYDALLYELVAAKGTVPEKGRKSSSIISQFQRFLKRGLELDFQLDAIDYKRENFVHADLSPTEFKKKQEERGETLVGIMLRSMIKGMQDEKEGKGSKVTILHIIAGFFAKDQARYHKFLFAQELTRMEEMLASFGDAKGAESTIIGDRNAACFAVLDQQLAKGKKKIGIFYGAAHLPDMESRLLAKGFKKTGTVWLTAWDLQK